MTLRSAIVGMAAVYSMACASPRFTEITSYEGQLPLLGRTALTTDTRPIFVANIECDLWYNPQLSFQRHSLVDENSDGKFDYGVVPVSAATISPPTKRVFPNDPETGAEFQRLEAAVQLALSARGKGLQEVERKIVQLP